MKIKFLDDGEHITKIDKKVTYGTDNHGKILFYYKWIPTIHGEISVFFNRDGSREKNIVDRDIELQYDSNSEERRRNLNLKVILSNRTEDL